MILVGFVGLKVLASLNLKKNNKNSYRIFFFKVCRMHHFKSFLTDVRCYSFYLLIFNLCKPEMFTEGIMNAVRVREQILCGDV